MRIIKLQKSALKFKDDEIEGFFGNVVFSCGLLYEDDMLKIYYGVADTAVCYAELPLKDCCVWYPTDGK